MVLEVLPTHPLVGLPVVPLPALRLAPALIRDVVYNMLIAHAILGSVAGGGMSPDNNPFPYNCRLMEVSLHNIKGLPPGIFCR